LEISVPLAEVDKETERVVAEIQKKVKLPGFRPGHAPVSLVRTRFAGDIRQDVLEKLVPRFFRAAVDKDHLQVVGPPNVSDVHFHAGEPLKFKAEFEVAPEFELGEYRGIVVQYTEPEVSDEDIAKRLDEIREQKAEYVNEEPRPLVDGDYALVSLESISGLAEKISQDEIMLKIGDESTLPAFTENLRGASPEESRVRRYLPRRLRAEKPGREDGSIPGHAESGSPQGIAGAERRIRQGSGRLSDTGGAEKRGSHGIAAGPRIEGARRGQASTLRQAGGCARFSGAIGIRGPADRDQSRKSVARAGGAGHRSQVD